MKVKIADRLEKMANEMLALAAEMRKKPPRCVVRPQSDAQDCRDAITVIQNTQRASTSHFQRQLGWGYNHAAKILDLLEEKGIVGPQIGAGPREIYQDKLLKFRKSKKSSAK